MSRTAVRTPEELKRDYALFQLQFEVQRYIVAEIISKLKEADYVRLTADNEVLIPFSDNEVIGQLEIIDDQIGDFTSLKMSLNQLGEDVNLSFDIVRNDDVEEFGFDPDIYPFLLALSAFPEEHYGQLVTETIKYDAIGLTYNDKEIIKQSDWQQSSADMN